MRTSSNGKDAISCKDLLGVVFTLGRDGQMLSSFDRFPSRNRGSNPLVRSNVGLAQLVEQRFRKA